MAVETLYAGTNWGRLYCHGDVSAADSLAGTYGGGSLTMTDTGESGYNAGCYGAGSYYDVYAAMYEFDTSLVPDGATIDSAVFSLRAGSKGGSPVLHVYTHDFGAAVTDADWVPAANYSSKTRLAVYDTASGWTADTRYDFTSDAAFLAAINKTGVTRMVLTTADIAANSWPGNVYASMYNPSSTTESYRPKLVVTYTDVVTDLTPLIQFGVC